MRARVHKLLTSQPLNISGDAVIGVDGAFSAVRESLRKKLTNFTYQESHLAHGYKELTLISCYPFYFVGAAPHRFIVHAIPARSSLP